MTNTAAITVESTVAIRTSLWPAIPFQSIAATSHMGDWADDQGWMPVKLDWHRRNFVLLGLHIYHNSFSVYAAWRNHTSYEGRFHYGPFTVFM